MRGDRDQGAAEGADGGADGGADQGEREVRPGVRWRAVAPGDAPVLSVLCRLTGDSGRDAGARTAFPDLLGDVYAAPYAHAYATGGPEGTSFGTLVLDGAGPAGYVLGCRDTARFEAWREEHWWPALRRRYPRPQDGHLGSFDEPLLRTVHEGVRPDPLWAERPASHPSHLHVDLLPRLQGRGLGRLLVERVCAQLAAAGSPGVHLGVSAANPGAVAFYRRTGFTELDRSPTGHTFGRVLSPPDPPVASPG
ncbi:GNAT family N-acetyltransferase [Kineococcus sp. LSe6-4]|uniref:GNAT family N-acetyltransferase n=1 Tax=Kineococcus halophytocola TaxID=3234027 RepID=A0ABV4GZG8_9ACTN